MKNMLLAALIAFGPMAFGAANEEQAESNEIRYCSAELIYADGQYRDFVRVDCESEFAGQCVKEVLRQNDESSYVATDMKECDAARSRQQ